MSIILAHGTVARALPTIAKEGLKPRGRSKRNNWGHTVGSNPNAIYLTSAYAFYFAYSAGDGKPCAVIEVKRDQLDESKLHADEDSLEQVMRHRPEDEPLRLRGWGMKRRTMYYRSRAHMYSADDSLASLGTCAYRGNIPPTALGRVVVVEFETQLRLILQYGLDPTISILGFKIMGSKYEQAQRWLFGDEPDLLQRGEPLGAGPVAKIPGLQIFPTIEAAIGH